MSYQYLLFEIRDKVAVVTFNRPEAMNALSPDVLAEFGAILGEIKNNEDIAVVVVTGAGKAFVAGADIKVMMKQNALEARNFSMIGQEVILQLEELPQPVIAAVNGFALGGGCEIAMGCDFIYASEKAKFGQPEINLGILPGFGGTQRLARLVGRGWAKELCLTGEMITAEKAREIGLVNKVFPADSFMDEVMKTAATIASKGKLACRSIKQVIDRGFQADLRTGLFLEVQTFGAIRSSVDAQEGLTAFAEKRPADFKGSYNK